MQDDPGRARVRRARLPLVLVALALALAACAGSWGVSEKGSYADIEEHSHGHP